MRKRIYDFLMREERYTMFVAWAWFFALFLIVSVYLIGIYMNDVSTPSTGLIIAFAATNIIALILIPGILIPSPYRDSYLQKVCRFVKRSILEPLQWKTESKLSSVRGQGIKNLRLRILHELSSSNASTSENLATQLRLDETVLDANISHLIWRGWAEEVGSETNLKHYKVTDRGLRELAAPGSTDNEPL